MFRLNKPSSVITKNVKKDTNTALSVTSPPLRL